MNNDYERQAIYLSITKTDKKKNGLQGYRVRIRYTTPTGETKQIERTAWGKAEAQAIEMQLINEMKNGGVQTRMTVRDLYDRYMQAQKHSVRESTYDKAKRIFEYDIIPRLGDIRLDKLTPAGLQVWKDEIASKDLALATKKGRYTQLNALLSFGVKQGYLLSNPLQQVGPFREVYFERPQDKLHFYTSDEYLRFSAEAYKVAEQSNTIFDWGFYVFFSIAFYTGARKGEINALKWTDIDGSIMHIRRNIVQKLKGGYRQTPPKNKSSYRDLQMPKPLISILDEHKRRQQTDSRFSEEWRVCGGQVCLRDTTIEKRNTQYANAAGLPHIRIHDFRHTHASLLVNEEINIQEIARRLGHSKVEQTWNTYSHLYPREEERAVAILDGIVLPESSESIPQKSHKNSSEYNS